MSDYISREAAIRANCYFCSAHLEDDSPCVEKCADYLKFVEIPAADVRENKRGRWIVKPLQMLHCGAVNIWVCSECGAKRSVGLAYTDEGQTAPADNFCPNCGARMEES